MVEFGVVDRGDGTGADFLISDAVGLDYEIFVAAIPEGKDGWFFVSYATGTGEGQDTYAHNVGVGAYVAVLICDGVPYGPKFFRITDTSLGVHYRCLARIREVILTMSLPLVTTNAARHKLRKTPCYTIKDFGEDPIGVHYWMLPERVERINNAQERTIYPIVAAFVQGNEKDPNPDPQWTKSRELLRIAMTGKALAGVPEVYLVNVVPAKLYGADAFAESLDIHSLIFECWTDQSFRLGLS